MDYSKSDEGPVKAGGVRKIPVETAKGTFQVWTKRVGNSPRMKLLLLHGGPAGSHMCMWDDQETYMVGLIKFMKAVDAGRKEGRLRPRSPA
jgi:hypothetical protein